MKYTLQLNSRKTTESIGITLAVESINELLAVIAEHKFEIIHWDATVHSGLLSKDEEEYFAKIDSNSAPPS